MGSKIRTLAKKIWHFLIHEDSVYSFVADAILILIIGKFILFPGLGLLLGTPYPAVAVVSNSMEHKSDFNGWWETNKYFYLEKNISKQEFEEFHFNNGFSKGDVLVINGFGDGGPQKGDVIVYSTPQRKEPIIHRVVDSNPVSTKGDANLGQIYFEKNINENQIHGKAVVLIPYLGWVKVGLMELIGAI